TALAWFPVARAAGTRLPAAGCKDRGDDGTGDGGLEEGPAAGVEATVRGGLGQGGHEAPLWYGDRTRSTWWGGSDGGREGGDLLVSTSVDSIVPYRKRQASEYRVRTPGYGSRHGLTRTAWLAMVCT